MVFPVDVAYTRHNLEDKVLMGLHTDPAELLDSMVRIENIAKKIGGKIFYSHDPEEYKNYNLCPDLLRRVGGNRDGDDWRIGRKQDGTARARIRGKPAATRRSA